MAQRLLLQAQTALGSYADPAWASRNGWPAFADRLLDLARESAPGSDHQLAFVNALCTSVLSPNHIAVLATLLDNEPAAVNLPGLVIDTDLRWRIVTALAAARRDRRRRHRDAVHRRRGAARPDRGGQAATPPRPSAARPQAAVKDAAWQQVDRGRHAGQHHRPLDHRRVRSAGSGASCWRRSGAKYFGAISGVWERRSSEVAQTVVIGLYPSWDISQAGLDAADEFLADPTCRRRCAGWWSKAVPGVERALRARRLRRHLTAAAPPNCRERACLSADTPEICSSSRTLAAACFPGGGQSQSQGTRGPQAQASRGRSSINDLTAEQWAALKAAWNGCAYCGATDGAVADGLRHGDLPGRAIHRRQRRARLRSCNTSKCNDEVTGWLRRKRLDERMFLTRYIEIRSGPRGERAERPQSTDRCRDGSVRRDAGAHHAERR